jgi:hypothetical protein
MGVGKSGEPRTDKSGASVKEEPKSGRKPYQRPAFRFEHIFETMALACGKVSATQGHCRFNRKSS